MADELLSVPYLTVLVGSTDQCNYGCRYCIRGLEGLGKPRMDDTTLENMVTKVLDYPGLEGVQFLWHGGEPLIAGRRFYEKAIALEKGHNKEIKIKNSIQTNGKLLTPDLLTYLLENNFNVAVSIDGPRDLHDSHRPARDGGSGTFDFALRAIGLIKEYNRRVGVISVVTQETLPRAREVFEFLTSIADGVKFRPMIAWGSGAKVKDDLGITPDEWVGFLQDIFPLWLPLRREKSIDPFQLAHATIMLQKPTNCATSSCYTHYLYVNPDGKTYLCSNLDSYPEFCYGNINADSLEQIFTSENRRRIFAKRRNIPECEPCGYYNLCNSGCVTTTYMVDGKIDHPDYWCKSTKALYDMIMKVETATMHMIEEQRKNTKGG